MNNLDKDKCVGYSPLSLMRLMLVTSTTCSKSMQAAKSQSVDVEVVVVRNDVSIYGQWIGNLAQDQDSG